MITIDEIVEIAEKNGAEVIIENENGRGKLGFVNSKGEFVDIDYLKEEINKNFICSFSIIKEEDNEGI